jgi:ADP-heptose:LPS heptosyltransferase
MARKVLGAISGMVLLKKHFRAVPKRVVILRALQLGDLMCAVPAFRALRSGLPEAHIALIGLPWSKEFVRRFHTYLDEWIEFPGFPGLPEREAQVDRFPHFLSLVQGKKFDLALQMQGSGNLSNSIVQLLGAHNSAGFCLKDHYCPAPGHFLEYPQDEPEVWRHLRLMEFLGIPLKGSVPDFPLYEDDWRRLEELLAKSAVADELVQQGLRVVLTGTASEARLTAQVASLMHAPALDLAGKTDLGMLGALLKGSSLLVCNDTGVSHVAAALQTPSVILFSASNPNRWAPENQNLHRVISWADYVSPGYVIEQAQDLIGKVTAYVV